MNWNNLLIRALFALLLLSCLAADVLAELPVESEQQFTAIQEVPDHLRSPRATLETFYNAIEGMKAEDGESSERLLSTIDLSQVNPLIRNERGQDLAWMLIEVMERSKRIDLQRVPDSEQGKPFLVHKFPQGRVQISRLSDGRWLFDKKTIEQLPRLFDQLAATAKADTLNSTHLPWHLRLRNAMPESLKSSTFGVEHWRWLGVFLVVLVGLVLDRIASMLLRIMVRRWRRKAVAAELQQISDEIMRPLGLMVLAVIWWLGLMMLGLPENALLVLLVAVKFLAALSAVWTAYRLVDLLTAYFQSRATQTDSKLDDVLVPLVSRTLKIFVTVIGTVFIADNLNINISSLLAGLGLGGLAFALAAKDMIQNLFGSVMVLLDRTFHVGDWVVIGDIEGSVEQIGFRSTKIRTFYNSLITLPNSQLITASVDNMGERRYRRMKSMLGLTYDTRPEQIEAFCEGVRELVRIHPYMRKDYYHVYFNGFGVTSLDILVYVFWETPDWGAELRERHRFLLDIHRLAERLGVEFAFPTQTLYLRQDEGATAAEDSLQQDALDYGRQRAREVARMFEDKPPPVTS